MSDSRARALLWRLVGWDESPSQFEDLLNDVESFLRQPVHPESRCQECGNDNPVWYAPHDLWNAVMGTPDNPRGEGVIVCPNCFTKRIPTPRSRAEPEGQHWQSDLTVDQHLLCDSNRAGKVTIDPTLLSPPTPRSRAEAEAMVEAYHSARDRMQIAAIECNVAEYHQGAFDMAKARAALLAALCGEGT